MKNIYPIRLGCHLKFASSRLIINGCCIIWVLLLTKYMASVTSRLAAVTCCHLQHALGEPSGLDCRPPEQKIMPMIMVRDDSTQSILSRICIADFDLFLRKSGKIIRIYIQNMHMLFFLILFRFGYAMNSYWLIQFIFPYSKEMLHWLVQWPRLT